MSESQTKGIILTLDAEGKAHHQFLGNITEVECMGLGQFLLTLPERRASGTLLQTMATLIEVNRRLADAAAEKTGEESTCGKDSCLESSPSSGSSQSSTKPQDPSGGS